MTERDQQQDNPSFGRQWWRSVLVEPSRIVGFVFAETLTILIIAASLWLTEGLVLSLFDKHVSHSVRPIFEVSRLAIIILYLISVAASLLHHVTSITDNVFKPLRNWRGRLVVFALIAAPLVIRPTLIFDSQGELNADGFFRWLAAAIFAFVLAYLYYQEAKPKKKALKQ